MKIFSAEFIRGAESRKDYPPTHVPEIAFAGRSNVGKSSMINSLLSRKNLVRTSKTPGLTRKINFFFINNSFIFVDLPGYGYASVTHGCSTIMGADGQYLFDRKKAISGCCCNS